MRTALKVTKTAQIELRDTLGASGDEFGLILYWCNGDTDEPDPAPDPAIWETVESRGWKLKAVPVEHLPADALSEFFGVRIFAGPEADDVELDFDGGNFLVTQDATEIVEFSR